MTDSPGMLVLLVFKVRGLLEGIKIATKGGRKAIRNCNNMFLILL